MTFPIVTAMPEVHFGVDSITPGEGAMTARMRAGRWLRDATGRPRAGSLGVLADNILGYAIIGSAPHGDWAVTTEMSVDVVGSLPEGGVLRGEAELLDSDRSGGFAEGRIVDESRRVVARVRQRGRFVSGLPAPASDRLSSPEAPFPRVVPRVTPDGTTVDLEVTAALTNPLGNLHGGVSLWLAETMGSAALHQGNAALETASIHVTYLRPAPLGSTVRVIAVPRHTGRSLGLADVRALLPDGRACIEATVVGHVT